MSRAAALLDYFAGRRGEAVALLGRLVAIDSPTSNASGVNRVGSLVAAELEAAGAAVRVLPGTAGSGSPVLAVFGGADRTGGTAGTDGAALLLGHLDTVWPMGEAERRPFRVEGETAYGPGVYDMKVGLVLCVLLARSFRDGVVRLDRPAACFFSADEETGSPASRAPLEAAARKARCVLGLEPSNPDGGAKTSRKGVGRIVVEVRGVAAHAGIDPDKGVNAVEEMAAQVLALKALQDRPAGTTLNAGLVSGGTARNVIPALARAEIDVRVPTPEEWRRVETAVLALRPRDARARLVVDAVLTHPPMVRTAAVAALYEQARAIARETGFDLPEGATGGGSDGSHCAALGIPVLDGLGVEGAGAHAIDERARVDRLAPRAAFLAALLERAVT